jgi:hypothetical protein
MSRGQEPEGSVFWEDHLGMEPFLRFDRDASLVIAKRYEKPLVNREDVVEMTTEWS